jgi:hypothetical protein
MGEQWLLGDCADATVQQQLGTGRLCVLVYALSAAQHLLCIGYPLTQHHALGCRSPKTVRHERLSQHDLCAQPSAAQQLQLGGLWVDAWPSECCWPPCCFVWLEFQARSFVSSATWTACFVTILTWRFAAGSRVQSSRYWRMAKQPAAIECQHWFDERRMWTRTT